MKTIYGELENVPPLPLSYTFPVDHAHALPPSPSPIGAPPCTLSANWPCRTQLWSPSKGPVLHFLPTHQSHLHGRHDYQTDAPKTKYRAVIGLKLKQTWDPLLLRGLIEEWPCRFWRSLEEKLSSLKRNALWSGLSAGDRKKSVVLVPISVWLPLR